MMSTRNIPVGQKRHWGVPNYSDCGNQGVQIGLPALWKRESCCTSKTLSASCFPSRHRSNRPRRNKAWIRSPEPHGKRVRFGPHRRHDAQADRPWADSTLSDAKKDHTRLSSSARTVGTGLATKCFSRRIPDTGLLYPWVGGGVADLTCSRPPLRQTQYASAMIPASVR